MDIVHYQFLLPPGANLSMRQKAQQSVHMDNWYWSYRNFHGKPTPDDSNHGRHWWWFFWRQPIFQNMLMKYWDYWSGSVPFCQRRKRIMFSISVVNHTAIAQWPGKEMVSVSHKPPHQAQGVKQNREKYSEENAVPADYKKLAKKAPGVISRSKQHKTVGTIAYNGRWKMIDDLRQVKPFTGGTEHPEEQWTCWESTADTYWRWISYIPCRWVIDPIWVTCIVWVICRMENENLAWAARVCRCFSGFAFFVIFYR